MHRQTRRDFLFTGAAAALAGAVPAQAAKRSATDWVTLGKSNVKVTRMAFGTGTFSGRVQRELGQDGFTRLVRHAYDRGIRFFETADAYSGMPQMLATALKGVPRDSYKLMTKYRVRDMENPKGTIDRFRSDLGSDYFDILLLHCVRSPSWPEETKKLQDTFSEAQDKKVILAHGASVHGLQGLRAFPGNKWLQVALLRTNHKGVKMDSMELRDTDTLGDVSEVFSTAKKLHSQGLGILGMKLIGEGQFTTPEDREMAMQKVMKSGIVDAVTIGFKSPAEVDEAIERMNRALNS
jgi:1-deoxyxylulose-5-phosphate synthase